MSRIDRFGRACGVLAPLVSLGAIAVAISLTPSFSWADSALSDLGVAGAPVPWVFNGGLILAGAFSLFFARWRWQGTAAPIGRAVAVGVAATGVSLAGVGLFPSGTAFHFPFAAGFYLLFTYTLILDGSARALAGKLNEGIAWIWVAVAHLTGWLLWGIVGVGGLAVPETFGASLLTAWFLATAWKGH